MSAVLGARDELSALLGRLPAQVGLSGQIGIGGQFVVVQELIEIGYARLVIIVVFVSEKGRVAHDARRIRVAIDGRSMLQVGPVSRMKTAACGVVMLVLGNGRRCGVRRR